MKKAYWIYFYLFICFLSCDRQTLELENGAKASQTLSGKEESLLISKDNLTISAEDAQNVATLFAEGQFWILAIYLKLKNSLVNINIQ